MKLRILCDNNTYIDQYYLGEPAFSCYIEAEDARVLLDVGYSDVFLRNAEKMGIDLSALTHVVLSHGHNDHTGGLVPFIEEKVAPAAKLIAHEDCFVGKYYGEEYIGAPYDAEQILYLADCQLTAEPVALTENLWYLGEIPRKLDFEPRTVIGKRERMGSGRRMTCWTIRRWPIARRRASSLSQDAPTAASATSSSRQKPSAAMTALSACWAASISLKTMTAPPPRRSTSPATIFPTSIPATACL